MDARTKFSRSSSLLAAVSAATLLTGCAMWENMMGGGSSVKLTGAQEVPTVNTSGSGTADIKVNDDRTISGKVTVSGMKPTVAHIHQAPAGQNGGVILPLTKTSDTTFAVPPNAKLTDAQYKAFQAGNLYVNVHSATYPNGELRGQLKP